MNVSSHRYAPPQLLPTICKIDETIKHGGALYTVDFGDQQLAFHIPASHASYLIADYLDQLAASVTICARVGAQLSDAIEEGQFKGVSFCDAETLRRACGVNSLIAVELLQGLAFLLRTVNVDG